jgi:hypothetical protein
MEIRAARLDDPDADVLQRGLARSLRLAVRAAGGFEGDPAAVAGPLWEVTRAGQVGAAAALKYLVEGIEPAGVRRRPGDDGAAIPRFERDRAAVW